MGGGDVEWVIVKATDNRLPLEQGVQIQTLWLAGPGDWFKYSCLVGWSNFSCAIWFADPFYPKGNSVPLEMY